MEKLRLMRHAFLLSEVDNKYDRLHGLREIVFQLEGSSDEEEYNERLSMYTAHLDNMDSSSGLNNFADEILKTSKRNGGEGKAWRSALDLDSLRKQFPAAFKSESLPSASGATSNDPTLQQTGSPRVRRPPMKAKMQLPRQDSPPPFRTEMPRIGPQTGFRPQEPRQQLQDSPPPFRTEMPRIGPQTGFRPQEPRKQHPDPPQTGFRPQESRQRPLVLKRPTLPAQNGSESQEINASGESSGPAFRTAREKLVIDRKQRQQDSSPSLEYGISKRSLGTTGRSRGVTGKFVPPVANSNNDVSPGAAAVVAAGASWSGRAPGGPSNGPKCEEETDERLSGLEPRMIELIRSEIMDHGPSIAWDDIAGLEFAKSTIKEIVIFPMLRPDIFTGLRGPPKGLLLFGPPGTGKTLIGKCIASQSKSTFFSISASTLTSKFVGEGEKMVRALFAVARVHQPSVVFMDEIDSLLTQRSEQEHESSRRIKTEFLVQLDGVTTSSEERILVVGATNRPQEIDEAARRRFVKRLYIPLPCSVARRQIVDNLLREQRHSVDAESMRWITEATEGYSGADVANLCREAAMGPVRSLPFEFINDIRPEDVRPISRTDFEEALTQVRASVSATDLDLYVQWNDRYGSFKRATG